MQKAELTTWQTPGIQKKRLLYICSISHLAALGTSGLWLFSGPWFQLSSAGIMCSQVGIGQSFAVGQVLPVGSLTGESACWRLQVVQSMINADHSAWMRIHSSYVQGLRALPEERQGHTGQGLEHDMGQRKADDWSRNFFEKSDPNRVLSIAQLTCKSLNGAWLRRCWMLCWKVT